MLPGEIIDPFPPADFNAAKARSVNYPVLAVVVTCGSYETVWKADSGFSYYMKAQAARAGSTDPQHGYAEQLQGVTVNGVALQSGVSQAFVRANKGYYFIDLSAQDLMSANLFISMPDGSNPMTRGNIVEVMYRYQFCAPATDMSGLPAGAPWLPWLVSVPQLSNKVDSQFGAIPQIGGGQIVIQNLNNFFDSRVRQNWDAGLARIYLGFSGVAPSLLATFIPANVVLDDSTFTINVKDPKVLTDVLFPSAIYSQATYPNIDLRAVGKPIQFAYGKIYGVAPVCIDTTTATFKVASHAIYSFDGVRVLNTTTNVWTTVAFASTNVATGQFTLALGVTWTVGQSVVVDFTGRLAAGTNGPMLNPADIVQDILQQLGVNVNTSIFSTVRALYTIGTFPGQLNSDGSQAYAYTLKPSLYLDTQAKALATIQTIMKNIRSYFLLIPDGSMGMVPFKNYPAAGSLALPVITDQMLLSMTGLKTDGSGTPYAITQAGAKPTQVQVNFAKHSVEGYTSSVVANSPSNQFTRGVAPGAQVPLVFESLFTDQLDALYLAQASLNDWRVDPYIYTVQLAWAAWGWLPGAQHVHLTSTIHGLDVVAEIISVKMDLTNFTVTLQLGNLRGFEQSSGFWTNSGDTTPSGASLAWPQQGETLAPTETEYRRHQSAFWHGADDLAVDSTVGGNNWDWRDFSVSRWQ